MKQYVLTEIELVILEWLIHCGTPVHEVVDEQLSYQQEMVDKAERHNLVIEHTYTQEQLTNALESLREATFNSQRPDEF